jgi:putative ABC transport system ATP-binding protein
VRGEAIGLVGPSGSGKSTLLMVMAGLERVDTGSIMVAGADLRRLDEDALARFRGRNVGIVFQSFHLIPTMTALENVAVPLELAGEPDVDRRARAELAVGLAERVILRRSWAASSNESRWRCTRARLTSWWPTSRPAILTGHRPAGDRSTVRRPERGTTLVLVTHDTALAQRCDRIVRLRSGRIERTHAAAQSG